MKDLIERIENDLSIEIDHLTAVHGGDISQAFALRVKNGSRYFLKYNDSDQHHLILSSEKTALDYWRQRSVNCPLAILYFKERDFSAILMDFIVVEKTWHQRSIENFASALVNMHRIHNEAFGFHKSNCIGSLRQHNQWYDNFEDYYWHSRIKPQILIANANSYLKNPDDYRFLYDIFAAFPAEEASLIHGDLWSGNYLIDKKGNCYFIDPSISYGNREMDLAMMKLFGGFPDKVYQIYDQRYPLKDGWKDRIKYFQLYYLLVHLNLFGTGYLKSVKDILDSSHSI